MKMATAHDCVEEGREKLTMAMAALRAAKVSPAEGATVTGKCAQREKLLGSP
jgi:hypothetical protein